MIDLVFKNYTSQKAPGERFFRKILEIAAQKLKLKVNFSISVNLVSEAKIKELNRKYRNKDKATDVLSFPLKKKLEIENPVKVTSGPQRDFTGWKLKIDEDLGDIFICLSIAKNDAKRENITIKQKLAQLTVHGFLHLLGHDHERSKRGAKEMFRAESQILSKIKV